MQSIFTVFKFQLMKKTNNKTISRLIVLVELEIFPPHYVYVQNIIDSIQFIKYFLCVTSKKCQKIKYANFANFYRQ